MRAQLKSCLRLHQTFLIDVSQISYDFPPISGYMMYYNIHTVRGLYLPNAHNFFYNGI